MAQHFMGSEKIGQLTQVGGVISLAPSRLTIGGQQYATGPLTLTANFAAQNTRYQIYAVLVAGVVTLVQSINENSVGPLGYTSWKLVGSFYTNSYSTPAFGSFVTIDGVPTTVREVDEAGSATLIAAIIGINAGLSLSSYVWNRVGRQLFVRFRLDACVGNASVARLPMIRGNHTMVEASFRCGTYAGQNGNNTAGGGSLYGSGSTDVTFGGPNLTGQALSAQPGTAVTGSSSSAVTGDFVVNINQWSATPIKDL